jgi:hypothetical protein
MSKPYMLRRALLPAAALIAASAVAVSGAAGQSGGTLVLTSGPPTARDVKRGDFKQVDLRPRGLSPGDYFLAAGSLKQDGRVVARAHAVCRIIDRTYRGQDCDFVLIFKDGTITASGGGLDRLLPGQPKPPPRPADDYAITGGTGAFDGASGTLSMQSHRDDSQTITVSLSS